MLSLKSLNGYLAFDEDECRRVGRDHADAYQHAQPFPHIMFESLLDSAVLGRVLDDFPSNKDKNYFDRDQERFKYQFNPQDVSSGLVRNLFAELNSEAFIAFLEELTGIDGLIADPHFEGGGLHETKRGGHLGIHADFNVHGRLNLQRRLNLLIYLNEDWDKEFGGDLELWNTEMTECAVKVEPRFGRAVIFSTDLDSFHGHPDPLNCPAERTRRSIATYYYSAPDDGVASLPQRTTNFQRRPGAEDKKDWQVRRYHFVRDWVPPKLQRLALRLLG